MGMFDDLLETPAPTSAPPSGTSVEPPAPPTQQVASLPGTPPEIAAQPNPETDADLGIGAAPKVETDEDLGIKPPTSKLSAALAGAESGLTLGYSPEIRGFSAAYPIQHQRLQDFRKSLRQAKTEEEREALRQAYWQEVSTTGHAPTAAEKAWSEAKTAEEERQKQAQEAHPYIYGAGNIAGTVLPMAVAAPEAITTQAIAKTAPLATRALGYASRGAQEAWRAFRGAAPIGAVAGLREGDTWADRLENSAIQAGLWGAGGVAGSAVGAGLTGAAKYAYGKTLAPLITTAKGWFKPKETASTIVSDALKADAPNIAAGTDTGLTLEQFAAAKAAGEPVSIMDLGGENTRSLLRSAGNISPEAWGQLESHLTDRFKDQTERIAGDVRKLTRSGDANALKTTDELRAAYDASRAPAYIKAYSQPAAQSIWDTELEHAAQAPMVQQAIRMANLTAKNEAAKLKLPPPKNPFTTDEAGKFTLGTSPTGEQLTPNLQFWDVVKKNLDGMGTEGKGWSKALREHLDTIVPEYKDARGVAQKYFNGMDAAEAGADAVGKKETPQLLARQFKQLPPAEQELFRESYASKMANDILNIRDKRDAAELLLNSPNDRARAEIIFGKEKLPILENRLRLEQVMQKAKAALGNSTTIKQALTLGLVGGGVGYYEGGTQGAGLGATMGATAAFGPKSIAKLLAKADPELATSFEHQLRSVRGVVNAGLGKQIANILTSNDPEALNRVAAMAAKNPKVAEGLKQLNNLFSQGISAMSAQTAGRVGAPSAVPTMATTTPPEPSRTGMFDDLLATPPPTAALKRAVGGMIEANPDADPHLVPDSIAFTGHDPRPGWQQFSGIDGSRYQLGPERAIRSALTLPSDVYSGRTPTTAPETGHTSDELVERSWDLAELAVGGGMPMAEAKALGSAGGKLFHPAAKPVEGLYSAVADAVSASKAQRLQPQQWLNWLKKQPNVRKEELDQLGLNTIESFPTNAKGLVEKDDILAHINQQDLPLHEVTRDKPVVHGQPVTPQTHGYDRYQLPGGKNYREIAVATPPKEGEVGYADRHWEGVPNVVGHLRVNDREIPDVGKSLHVEEMQSDWHQKARDQRHEPVKTAPDGPYSKTWHELLLKHALNKAVKEGYDAISWTPGKLQTQRYNDDNHLVRLEHKDGKLRGVDAEGFPITDKENVPLDELHKHTDKEFAAALKAKAPNADGARVLEGDELTLKGEGHNNFYDKLLVGRANSLGKAYGAQVEKRELPGAGKDGASAEAHVLRLTPELKQQLLSKGLPKFKRGGALTRARGGKTDHNPTEAQKHAGNYSKRQVVFQGLNISIENEKGSVRKGIDAQGTPWEAKMPTAYGYIKGTVGKDKDHLDVYVGPHAASKHVFVVDQVDPETGRFDEHKIMLGFGTKNQALNVYKKAFSDGSGNARVGKAHSLSMQQLKDWLSSGDTKAPFKHQA